MRKIYALLLPLSIVMFSCSKGKLAITPGENKPGKSLIVNGGQDQWDLLGYGYDVTGPLLDNNNSSDSRIIDIAKLVNENPDRISQPTDTRGDDHFHSGETAYEYLKDVTKSYNADAGRALPAKIENTAGANNEESKFTGSIKASFSSISKYSFSSKYSFASYDKVFQLRRLKIVAGTSTALLTKYLNPSFVQDVASLSPADLVRRYGTHVLLDISVGGRLVFAYKSAIVKESNSSQKTTTVSAGIGGTILKATGITANVGLSTDVITTYKNDNTDQSLSLVYRGGTNSGESYSFNPGSANPTTINVNVAQWESSVTAANAALTEINRAIPISEFISDPGKKSQVAAAIEKYIADSQIKVLALKTLYRMHSKNGNIYYVFSQSAVDEYRNRWGDTFEGIDGHILQNAEAGSKTLYRMHSNNNGKTFYVFSQSAVDEYRTRWGDTFEGIDGYILQTPEQGAETRTLYRMHSKNGSIFYVFSDAAVNEYRSRWGDTYEGIDGYIYN
jgi:hypothetical protein